MLVAPCFLVLLPVYVVHTQKCEWLRWIYYFNYSWLDSRWNNTTLITDIISVFPCFLLKKRNYCCLSVKKGKEKKGMRKWKRVKYSHSPFHYDTLIEEYYYRGIWNFNESTDRDDLKREDPWKEAFIKEKSRRRKGGREWGRREGITERGETDWLWEWIEIRGVCFAF